MRVISEAVLRGYSTTRLPSEDLIDKLLEECQELQEPWIPIDEFLKYGSEVWCWIIFTHGAIRMSLYQNNEFYFNSDTYETYYKEDLTHVMPIHKPEPPR